MAKQQYEIEQLRKIVEIIRTPLRNVPFGMVIHAISGHAVLPYNGHSQKMLEKVVEFSVDAINKEGISSNRPNEVGNLCEPFVKDAIEKAGGKAETPRTASGNAKSTGYPDIDACIEGLPFYIEIKSYNRKNEDTTQRSFYLSPSQEFKVTRDAYHLVLAFEMKKEHERYKAASCSVLDVMNLPCDLKHEFNSDNRRMYRKESGLLVFRRDF